jgi:hypothetical protein
MITWGLGLGLKSNPKEKKREGSLQLSMLFVFFEAKSYPTILGEEIPHSRAFM